MAMEGPTCQLAIEFGGLQGEGLNGSSQPRKSLTGHPCSASVCMDSEGPDAGLGDGLFTQQECFFRGHRKTNETKHCPSFHPTYLLGLTCSWISNWKVIPEQLFLQMSHLEIQQKTNLVLFQSNTCPHIATYTCSGR